MFTFTTALDAEETMMHAQSYMTQDKGYILDHRDGNTLTFTRTQKPSIFTFLVLLLFFILPALLYLIFAWKKQTCSVFIKTGKEGTTVMVDAGLNSQLFGRGIRRSLAKQDKTLKARFSILKDIPSVYLYLGIFIALILVGVFMSPYLEGMQ